MKSLSKHFLLFLLGTICLITLFSNSSSIDASTKLRLKNGKALPSTLYIGKSYTLKTPNSSTTYTTNDSGISTVQKKTGKIVLKYPGIVTFYARNKHNGKTLASKQVKVLRRTDYLTSSNTELILSLGQRQYLSVKKSPSHSSDALTFRTSNSEVVTVDANGLLNPLKAGTANVTVYSKATKQTSYKNKNNKKLIFHITVYGSITTVKQTERDRVEVTFNSLPDAFSTNDFTVRDSKNQIIPISNTELSTTSKRNIILTLGRDILDGDTYTVSFHNKDSSFKASNGEIAKLAIEPTLVKTNVETELKASAYDEKGIKLEEYIYGKTYTNVTFTIYGGNRLSNNNIIFYNPNETATARITYRKYKNNILTNTIDSGNVTIKSYYDPASQYSGVNCCIVKSTDFNYTSAPSSYNTVPKYSSGYYAHFRILDATGKEVTDYSKFRVEPSIKDYVSIDSNLYNSKKYISIYGYKEGSLNLNIIGPYNAIIASIPIYVSPELKPTSIALSTTSVQTSPTSNGIISYAVKDQENNDWPAYVYLKCISTSGTSTSVNTVNNYSSDFYQVREKEIQFFSYVEPGVYVYKVSYNNLEQEITVYVSH